MARSVEFEMSDEIVSLVDKLVMIRLEEVLELTQDEAENQDVYEATKVVFEFFGGDVDEY
jgi:valyl-tRNA synthetase